VERVDPQDAKHGPEDFVGVDIHLCRDVIEQRGADEKKPSGEESTVQSRPSTTIVAPAAEPRAM
jgi:hypothetical protein